MDVQTAKSATAHEWVVAAHTYVFGMCVYVW